MVSLTKSSEATSFSNMNINAGDEDTANGDTEVLVNTVGDENNIVTSQNGSQAVIPFRTLDTIGITIWLIFSSIAIFTLATVLPIECHKRSCGVTPMSLLLYLHSIFWGISLICDQCIQYHHIKIRRRGYLEFYNKMRTLSQLPFWIVSTWSTLLLTISTILHDHCRSADDCGQFIRLKKINYITISIGLELVILLIVLFIYLGRVWRFNGSKPLPDVLRDDLMSGSIFGLNSIGPLDEEIYERQADMIHYYKEHNSMLRKTVSELSQQLSAARLNS